MSIWLTPDELIELTGRTKRKLQREALAFMRIEFRLRPDGFPLVLRSIFDNPLKKSDKRKEPRPLLRMQRYRPTKKSNGVLMSNQTEDLVACEFSDTGQHECKHCDQVSSVELYPGEYRVLLDKCYPLLRELASRCGYCEGAGVTVHGTCDEDSWEETCEHCKPIWDLAERIQPPPPPPSLHPVLEDDIAF